MGVFSQPISTMQRTWPPPWSRRQLSKTLQLMPAAEALDNPARSPRRTHRPFISLKTERFFDFIFTFTSSPTFAGFNPPLPLCITIQRTLSAYQDAWKYCLVAGTHRLNSSGENISRKNRHGTYFTQCNTPTVRATGLKTCL